MQKEKVIESLEFCINHRCGWNCYYAGIDECEMELKKDALSILKEQEAVEPVDITSGSDPIITLLKISMWECGNCGERIAKYDKYCPECGKAVKWE